LEAARDGLGLGLEGVEVVDKVKDRRSSDKISKLCERRPESTIEFSHPISGDEALELEDVFGVVDRVNLFVSV
jgi:hypothetical protein